MPVVDVYNLQRSKVGSVELSDDVFDTEVREHLFHEVVRYQLAARRSGTAKAKERWEINKTTAKVWRQKGTGRARQGSKRAPQWVGGGVVFGPKPRDFAPKVNKKVRKAALKAALSRRHQEGALVVVEDFQLPDIKTKRVAEVLTAFEAPKTLIVDVDNEVLGKSARNLGAAKYLPVVGLNVYDILRHDKLILTKAAAEAIEGRLK